jgi:uncharacterized protein (TIGR03086 family)
MNVEKTVIVPLDPEQTFALITEPERLRRWNIIAGRIAVEVGGESRMTVAPGYHAVGRLLELDPGHRIAWTQSWEGRDEVPEGSATVTITLEPVEGGTRLTLVHAGLDEEQAAGHAEGWDWYLQRLLAVASGRDPGPDDWGGLLQEADAAALADASLSVLLRVLRDLPPEALARRTPCRDFDVAALLDHLAGSLEAASSELGITAADAPGGPAEDRMARLAQPVLEAFTRRLREGTLTPRQEKFLAGMLNNELLVHAWDFATAIGRPLDAPPELAERVLELGELTPELRAMAGFDDAVPVPPDASALDRLVAHTGRVPRG